MRKLKRINDLYTRLIDLRKNRIIWLLAAVMIVVVVIIGMVTGHRKEPQDPSEETITIIKPSEEEVPSETADEQLEHLIQELVSRYFTARAACDLDTLKSVCETSDGFDLELLQEEAAYTEAYRNISCMIRNGLVEGTYIVYAYYEIKFEYIDTLAPALSQLYIKTDADGLPYVYQGVIDGELSAYMAELTAGAEISELANEVNRRLEEACKKDRKLDLFIRFLQGEISMEPSDEADQ